MYSKVLCLLLISSFIGSSYQILCSNSCAVNETFSECGAGGGECQKTCRTRRRTEDLGCPCVAGCVCIDGYFRDPDTYKCIKRSDCGPIVALGQGRCPLNERWSKCSGGCQNDCNNIGALMKCACKSGCVCRIGYIRSPITNQCILEKACKTCPKNYIRDKETGVCKISCELCKDPNAVYNKCGSSCSEGTCKNPNGLSQICTKMCETGCFCKTGYVKNDAGKCVLPKTCPIPKCPLNEEYTCKNPTCESGCLPRPCLNVPCQNKCYCKAGYVRENGLCIPKENCLKCKDPNSYANECGSACEATCKNPNPKGPCPDVCVKGCFCNPGYLKNDQGVCVPVEKCPKACPKYEIFSCGSGACEKNCKNLKEKCTIVNIKCDDKCFCIDGYVRAFGPNGPCIPVNTCPIVDPPPTECADPNAEYTTCGSKCNQPKCSSVGLLFKCLAVCEVGCFCKKGFFLDSQGKCVAKCTECPENESFSCGSAACEKDCSNINEKCNIVNIKCDDKCFCNKGFVRAYRNGPCIPIEKCNGQCPANEIMDCRNPTCLNEGCVLSRRPCLDVPCEKRCYCADGFARINGVCVPREKCNIDPPPMDCKDPNASFKSCGSACEPTCDKPNPLICTMNCVSGCFCNAGYMKDSTGVCIPIEKCPKPSCKDPNSEYSCGNPYCEPSCSTLGQVCDVHIKKCENKCYCKTGYVLSDSGICIPIEKCPKKCPLNEVFSCGSAACEKNCGNINEKCLIVNKKCDDKCFCIEGYVRAFGPNGPCISVETCPFIDPPPKVCPDPNAEYTTCGSACEPICGKADPMFCTLNCVEGCFCKAGFIKDSSGICIPIEKCPISTCKDPNSEHNTCGSSCSEATCKKPEGQSYECPEMCETGCFCKKGFVKNEEGKCVLPETCPIPKCPMNEEYKCGNENCERSCRLGRACLYAPCTNKCYCKAGFVRDKGVCIPEEQCLRCDDRNSYANECGSACEASCKNPNPKGPCPDVCVRGCFCRPGFLKNDQGVCVPVEECPKPIECPANEVYDCRHPTCGEQGCFWLCRPAPGTPCVNKCFCADGYRRINGICILEEKCPKEMITCNADETFECREPVCTGLDCFMTERPPKGSVPSCEYKCYCAAGLENIDGKCVPENKCPMPNTEYRTCVNPCTEPSCAHPTTALIKCRYACIDGCYCKKGFLKDDQGNCVEKCPSKECPTNEVMDCRNPTCDYEGCKLIGIALACQFVPCVTKCYCAPGFVRINGVCAPEKKCPIVDPPPTACADPNAEYTTCGSRCNQPKCSSVGLAFMCLPKCEEGCFCKKGFFLDSKGKCVAKCTECPENESFSCGSAACEKDCSNINETCDIVNIKCDDKCFCNKGFVRAYRNGPCIPIDQCNGQCPANEIMDCRNPTCLNEGCFLSKRACLDVPCEKRCYCQEGFARIDGVCVPREKCFNDQPMDCKDSNASYNTCGSACEPICGKKNPLFCTANCVVGCFCNKGYIKDSTGVCIPIEKCNQPKDCPGNEVFDCRHPTCGERGCFVLCRPDKDTPCENRCFCADGYYRENGICIPEDKCPKEPITCDVNEVFECRNPTCDDEGCFMMGRPCQNVPCQYKCYCAPGLVRIDGKCVSRKKCFSPIEECLMPNTEYKTCVNPCTQPSCANPTTALIKCAYACVDGCFCSEGFYKSDDGSCIELDQCPRPCPETCPANESCSCQLTDCERNCDNRRYPCDPIHPNCVTKCFCNSGFIRQYGGGPCIPYDQCDPIWGDLEIAEM